MNLEEWNAQYAADDDEDFNKPASRGFPFDFDVTYKVRATSARAVKSAIGSRQVELKLEIVTGDEIAGNATEWVTLPIQPETDAKLDKATVLKLTKRRRDDLRVLLACADADNFSVPENVRGPAWEARALEINKKVMAYAQDMHREIEANGVVPLPQFNDVTFYFIKRANRNKPEYPFTNWSESPKKGVKVFTGNGSSDTPF